MTIIPLTLRQANDFVAKFHRHNKPVCGYKFAIGAMQDDILCGVAIVGRPIARLLDNGLTAEITRVCTDGTKNANSFLYGACRKVCHTMGYKRIITYTLKTESGASLRAVGTVKTEIRSGDWHRTNRPRKTQAVSLQDKIRWEV